MNKNSIASIAASVALGLGVAEDVSGQDVYITKTANQIAITLANNSTVIQNLNNIGTGNTRATSLSRGNANGTASFLGVSSNTDILNNSAGTDGIEYPTAYAAIQKLPNAVNPTAVRYIINTSSLTAGSYLFRYKIVDPLTSMNIRSNVIFHVGSDGKIDIGGVRQEASNYNTSAIETADRRQNEQSRVSQITSIAGGYRLTTNIPAPTVSSGVSSPNIGTSSVDMPLDIAQQTPNRIKLTDNSTVNIFPTWVKNPDGSYTGTADIMTTSVPAEYSTHIGANMTFATTNTTTAGLGTQNLSSLLSADDIEDIVKKISLYPNPAEGSVNIKLPSVISEAYAEIYDMSGRAVSLQNTIDSLNNQIDISSLQTGTYIINITDKNDNNISTSLKLMVK